jgi:hypothetical protein
METRMILPAELVEGTSVTGNEYGWPLHLFPDAARRAESLGYACLGGQFQFRIAAATCEMYWLAADSSEREPNESWRAYCERSRVEVLGKFAKIIAEIDFLAEARNWPTLTAEIERGLNIAKALFFVAYFVTDGE